MKSKCAGSTRSSPDWSAGDSVPLVRIKIRLRYPPQSWNASCKDVSRGLPQLSLVTPYAPPARIKFGKRSTFKVPSAGRQYPRANSTTQYQADTQC